MQVDSPVILGTLSEGSNLVKNALKSFGDSIIGIDAKMNGGNRGLG